VHGVTNGKEVSVQGGNEFAGWEIFDPQSDLWQARQASADERISPSDCIRVKTPSQGVTTFDIDGDPAKEIRGILCYIAKRGVVWPFAEMKGSGEDPVFTTDDLVTARRVGSNTGDLDMAGVEKAKNADGTYRWRELPFVYPNGHRDRESRILYVLREGDVLPLAINASAASVYAITTFIKRLAKPVWRHCVTVSLIRDESEKGIPYAKYVVKVSGVLTPEQGEVIKSLYSRGLAAMVGVDIDHPLSIASSAAPRGLPGPAPAQTSAVTVDAVPAPSSDDGVPF
jgi:hypothetical protein